MNVDSFKFLIVAGCFFISLGVIEIIDNRPFAKWPHLQKYERISSADFHYSDGAYRIGTISVESFKYGRLRFGGTKLWRFGELSLDKTQFRFHLPAQRRALLGCTP